MPDALKAEKEASDLRYSTARKIGKLLTELPAGDVPVVLGHVALEFGLVMKDPDNAAVAGKVA